MRLRAASTICASSVEPRLNGCATGMVVERARPMEVVTDENGNNPHVATGSRPAYWLLLALPIPASWLHTALYKSLLASEAAAANVQLGPTFAGGVATI